MIAATAFLFICAVMVVTTLLRGWVLSIVWNWFIPALFGLPSLRIAEAIALSLIVTFLTHQDNDCQPKERDDTKRMAMMIVMCFAWPLLTLLIAWIVRQFV